MKREYGALEERKCQESPEILGEPLPLPPLHRGLYTDWSAFSVRMAPYGTVYITVCHRVCHRMSPYVTLYHRMSPYITVCHRMSQYVTVYVTVCHRISPYVTVCHRISPYVTVCHRISPYITVHVTVCHRTCHRRTSKVNFTLKHNRFFFLV